MSITRRHFLGTGALGAGALAVGCATPTPPDTAPPAFLRGPLAPGMCFSDEPTVAIYGEFGIRLEDCLYMTDNGPRFFTKQSVAIDQPFG